MAGFKFRTRMCSLWLNTSSFLTSVTCSVRVDRMFYFIYSGAQANGDTAIFRTLLLFSCQVVSDSLQPHWTAACQASVSLTISRSLPKFMSIELVIPSNHLILFFPLLLLPLIFPNMCLFLVEEKTGECA